MGTAKHKFAAWSGSRPAERSEYKGTIKRLMHRLNLLPGPDERHDWKKEAPRWALLVGLLLAAMVIGWLASKLETSEARQMQRLEAAWADAPTKYQARLSERVAANEAEIVALRSSVLQLSGKLDKQTEATTELTIQLRLLNAEMKARR